MGNPSAGRQGNDTETPQEFRLDLMDPLIIPRSQHPVSRKQIDPDALKVLYRLHRRGKIAYLVGGGVRDLLLGIRPKDFDVVTDARPGEVKKLFRNSWIVGRRFRLVHVVFGRKVVEVATFRAKSEEEAEASRRQRTAAVPEKDGGPDRRLLVTWENTFGTPEQDARRRDFTINALFYDISTYSLIDYVGGLADLEDQAIRTIGDPHIRFQEDPVRMMRAVKFAARLGFRLEAETLTAIRHHAAAIGLSAPPRVLEEIYRLLGTGQAEASFRLLAETELLPHLVPEVQSYAAADGDLFWSYLAALDRMTLAAEEEVSRSVQMAVLLYHLVREPVTALTRGSESLGDLVQDVVRPVAQRLRMTRADTARMIQMFLAQRRFLRPRGRRFSVSSFVRRGYFPGAFQLFRIHVEASGENREDLERWGHRVRELKSAAGRGESRAERTETTRAPRKRRRRRRGGRRRRPGGASG
jgi:poly(A) polymerase